MKPFISFVHIGKTGGLTFHQILNDNLKFFSIKYEHKTKDGFTSEHLNELLKIKKVEGIGGHTIRPYLDYEKVLQQPVYYVTFIREPISRFISYVNYRIYLGWSKDLTEVLEDERLHNQQIFELAGVKNFDQAQTRLEKVNFMAVTDQYNASLILLKSDLQKNHDSKLNINYQKENVAKDRNTNFYSKSKLSKKTIDKILAYNAEDVKLYEYAKNRFEKRAESYEGNLTDELEQFVEANKSYNRPRLKFIKHKARNFSFRYLIQPYILSKS